ncbi:hypothetical protein [uncultured Jatrophihabitans sp.]|uniref:hypothetical protein n=1 Tax=uncultured Jatrophihabitans sp. TaxID=1610747 RepID=UPI0035C98E51
MATPAFWARRVSELTEVLADHAYDYADFDAELLGARHAVDIAAWEVEGTELRLSVKATTKLSYPTPGETFAAASELLDRIVSAGDGLWRPAVRTSVEVHSVDSAGELADDDPDDQVIEEWFGLVSVNLLPPVS